MLWTPANQFQTTIDNFGATITNGGLGAGLTANASANVKGTAVALVAGGSVTEDVYGIMIQFCGGDASATVRQYLTDLLIDPAGGTSYTTTLIANLVANSPNLECGGFQYYFPLYVKSGVSFAGATQCSTGGATLRMAIKLFCKPSRPDLVKTGSFVRTIGANTAGSNGTAITPGTNARGTYTSLGATADDLWWWQVGHAINDTTQGTQGYLLDMAVGDASNKYPVIENVPGISGNTSEKAGKAADGGLPPIWFAPSGVTLYARASCIGTPDSSFSMVGYGLGG